MSISYADAGVNIERGDKLVEDIKKKVASTYGSEVVAGVGGFSSLYKIDEDRYLTAGTDGVGTKLLLAQKFGIHNTIGIDLVAMCVNDILCTGSRPLFFMDYLASGELILETSNAIIDGVVEGCKQSSCALIGGETAEMPGMYSPGEYDLAGFAVGEVYKDKLINGSKVTAGQYIIGIHSSGAHSNGYSLIRHLFKDDEVMLRKFLKPTTIYTSVLSPLVNEGLFSGLAHITGGGIHNISRINSNFNYRLDEWIDIDSTESQEFFGDVFSILSRHEGLTRDELFKTFNMGLSMVGITDRPELILSKVPGSKMLGRVEDGKGKTYFS
mgnify:CR=1 FL=1